MYCNRCGEKFEAPNGHYRYCEGCRETVKHEYFKQYRKDNRENLNAYKAWWAREERKRRHEAIA